MAWLLSLIPLSQMHSRQNSYTQKKGEVALAREMLCRQDPEGYALACEALAQSSIAPWKEITAKAIVVSGEEDKVSTVAVGKSIGDNLASSSEQCVLSDTGHWHMLEQPDEIGQGHQESVIMFFLLADLDIERNLPKFRRVVLHRPCF